MSAPVIDLDAARARRASAATRSQTTQASSATPATISAGPGRVVLALGDGAELDLSPQHARVWAERLSDMADVAESLEKGGSHGFGLQGDPDV